MLFPLLLTNSASTELKVSYILVPTLKPSPIYVTMRKHEFLKAEKHGFPENTVCVGTHYSHHP